MTAADARALDATVARVVFDTVPCPHWEIDQEGYGGGAHSIRLRVCPHEWGRCYPDYFSPPFPYSSNITDAWRVVEAMKVKGWWFSLDELNGGEYRAQFGNRAEVPSVLTAALEHAPTASEAIARAAIRALGGDDGS